jgi:uncharacterized protein with HEPN domain
MKTAHDYLLDMQEYTDRVAQATRDGKSAFDADFVIQDAVIRQYEVIGEIAKRLPDDLLNTQPNVNWRAVKGFRDFLSHNYDRVDLEVVWQAVEQLPTLQKAIRDMLDDLSK